MEHTIAAICTPPGNGALGIIRLSGVGAFEVADRVFRAKSGKTVTQMESHTASFGDVIDRQKNRVIDQAVVTKFAAPKSYTGEDTVEFCCHGGSVLLKMVLQLCLENGARLALPGEFSKRAFLNGKLDLAEAEAVIEMVTAKSELDVYNNALLLMGGASKQAEDLRERVLTLAADILAKTEFPEEEVDEISVRQAETKLCGLLAETSALRAGFETGRVLSQGVRAVLAGRPNVGKSSLLNALLKENRAIVTDIAGTTRDTVEEYATIRGILFRLVDTAGIREARDEVEKIGVQRALGAIDVAEVVLLVKDASQPPQPEDEAFEALLAGKSVIRVYNKADLGDVCPGEGIRVSATSGEGMEKLLDALEEVAGVDRPSVGVTPYLTSVRQAEAVSRAEAALLRAQTALRSGMELDLITIDLQQAAGELGQVTGKTVGEEVLDNIFSRFCIGK